MKIAIGSDHGGFHLKAEVVKWLREKQIEVIDLGAQNLDSIDYPDVAQAVAEEVLLERADRGILICGTGIGISIAANKIDGIRAALCHDVYSA